MAKSKKNIDTTILVCDDDEILVDLIAMTLKNKGYEVIETENGEQAIEAFQKHAPDLVLMDASMPGMDGFEVTKKISSLSKEPKVPIIMITALEDGQSVKKAFESGAVEYVTKPILWPVLLQRIRLQIEAYRNFEELQHHHQQLTEERALVEDIIRLLRNSKPFDPKGINFLIEPVDKTAGDMLLSARRPDGAHNILLGDVTGHGLPAAIIGPTVADIFYSMTNKGFSPGIVLSELNKQLHLKLPRNYFLAGCWITLDVHRRHMEVWGGGMLDMLIFRDKELIKKIPSNNLALGIREEDAFNMTVTSIPVKHGDRVYAYSDGIIEQKNPDGEQFSQKRFIATLTKIIKTGEPLEKLKKVLDKYRGKVAQADDVTVVEIIC
ncbi:MAG: fused response regulator/phosphatase [Magnetococcales bacterium]|nr:fused response regulator/phosphatase [Magnetococcales bacterium]